MVDTGDFLGVGKFPSDRTVGVSAMGNHQPSLSMFADTRHFGPEASQPGADGSARHASTGHAPVRWARPGSSPARLPTVAAADRPIRRLVGGRLLPRDLRGAVFALGNFDGFHLGHQAVVGRAVDLARKRGVAAIVATFDPHPVRHFTPDATPFRLTTLDQRQRMFAAAGVEAMMVFHFDEVLADVTPESFVQRWLAGAGGIVTGGGYRFGRKRAGTVGVLAELAAREGLSYETVHPVSLDGQVVSSTRVREALRAGDCSTAGALLTRPFSMYGDYHDGGSLPGLGFPAVLAADDYLRPLNGAYAAHLRSQGGVDLPGIVRFVPNAAGAGSASVLRVETSDLLEALHGRSVEVDLVRHLPGL